MKPDPGFDDEIKLKSSRRWWTIRSIWQLMLVVAASALTMAIIAGKSGQLISPKFGTGLARVSVIKPQAPAIASQAPDSFVIVANGSLDPKMVVPAPLDIDEAMVFNPESRGRLPLMAPGTKSTLMPDGVPPQFWTPPPR